MSENKPQEWYQQPIPMWVAHDAAETVEWMRHHAFDSESYRTMLEQVFIPILGQPPYVEVFFETVDVPGFVPNNPQSEIYHETGGGYFAGSAGVVNGKPAIVGGFGDSNHSAPDSVIMSLQHWADLPQVPPELE
jgi:hypothetical protein